MASSTTFSDSLLITHMLSIKLSSTNYLYWLNQMIPLLTYQNLISHVDGSSVSPPPTLPDDKNNQIPNPDFISWKATDLRCIILLNASLTEEVVSNVIGLTLARDIWVALETAYSNSSNERVQTLRDQLRLTLKGDKTVAEFGRNFKAICDKLTVIGHPVEPTDQFHWFLSGLGPSFEMFSIAERRSAGPIPSFSDLVTKAESHELFIKALHGSPSSTSTPALVFSAQQTSANGTAAGRGRYRPPNLHRGSSSRIHGQDQNRPPRPPPAPIPVINDDHSNSTPIAQITPPVEKEIRKLRIFIVFYSMFGHVESLARSIKKGVEEVDGVEGVLFRVPETLTPEALTAMKVPVKSDDIPEITAEELVEADGLLFGFPTRYGCMAAQMKAFFDSTGELWRRQELAGVPAGFFVSTGTQGGGQESTAWTAITQLAHHGMLYVPIGYTFGAEMFKMDSIRGGSPYGAGVFSGDGTREPTQRELEIAKHQGKYMAIIVKRFEHDSSEWRK